MLSRWIGCGATAVLLTLLSAGPAAASNAVSIGSPVTLTDRLLVKVPVVVVCDPLPGGLTQSFITVQIQQAAGQSVSSGITTLFSSPTTLVCDGVTRNRMVAQVTPGAGNGPFHGGGAIVSASFFVETGTTFETGSTGPTPVRIAG